MKKKMSQVEAAAQVLADAKEPMSCRDMVAAMKERKLWTSPNGKYLHLAHAAGLVRPVYSSQGGIIRGWVPPDVDVPESLMDARIDGVADAVRAICKGAPVSTKAVAAHMQAHYKTVGRWLREAWRRKRVVHSNSPPGWLPA